MLYATIQTIQLLGRRVILKISYLSGALVFSGLFQIIPLMFILPIIRVAARPGKQSEGLPRRMKRLLPEDLANTIDQFIATTETKTLIVSVVLIALVLFGIQALMTKYIKKYLRNFLNIQSRILANKLFLNYLEADIFSYANPMAKIESGCDALVNLLNNAINSLFAIVMFLLVTFILIYIYPLPGLVSVTIIITATALLAFFIQPKMSYMIQQAQMDISKGRQALADSMRAIKEIKLMGREKFFFNSYLESQISKQNQELTKEKYASISAAINIVMRYLGLVSGIVLAIYTLPKEELMGFTMIFMLLAMRATAYAQQIISQTETCYKSLLVLNLHYGTLLKYDSKSKNFGDTPIVCKESIEFKDVYFRHKDTKEEEEEDYETTALMQKEKEEKEEEILPFVLENLNLKIKQGEFIGLVGRNGSGKSTILDLLSGLMIPTQGGILINGKQLGISDRKNWRKQINYVIQKPQIISETILYNVTLGLTEEETDQQLLERALELSMLEQVIEQLPKGLQTEVGTMGTKISGGQAQRIALARAFYQNRPILLLDEATRAIDAATEAEIMEKILTMRGEKTAIIVTHRVQSLKQCDRIYVVEDKKIAAEGDYETLCKTSKLFRLFALGETGKQQKKRQKIPSVA